MLASVRRFHEEPVGVMASYYTRDRARLVRYETNFDLFTSPAANWHDTLFMDMKTAEPEDVPPACQGTMPEYTAEVKKLALLQKRFVVSAVKSFFVLVSPADTILRIQKIDFFVSAVPNRYPKSVFKNKKKSEPRSGHVGLRSGPARRRPSR
jgi:hypothetical protein